MTSLEIKRLDSENVTRTSSKSSIISPTRSNLKIILNSSPPQTAPKTPSAHKNDKEIPINIVKSASYAREKSQQSEQISPNMSLENSNLNNSDNIPDINTDTLRFNKYGFIQSAKTEEIYSDTQPSKTDTLKKIFKSPNNTLNRTKEQEPDDTDSMHTISTKSNITNLKDYIQNTDVEEFSENIPIKVIQLRELKWVEMLKNFDEWMDKRFRKIKSRCRKGIPQSMRSKAWMHLTGAILLKKNKPNYYNECLNNPNNLDVAKYIEDIKKDLHRQFPSHEIFMKREGRQMLFNVLKAYAVHNKEVGYCQAQGPIAALLLMHMPEEDAFWMLIRISDFYLKEYYKPGLEKVQIDGHSLFNLFKKENLPAYKLMVSQSIDPVLYMTEWFMCVYARTLPWCTVLRVWDMFFCEGIKVLYRVGLYLMLSAFSDKQKFQRCQQQGMYETLNLLKNLPIDSLTEAELVRESSMIKISESELRKAFEKSRAEFSKEKNEKFKKTANKKKIN
ncbi:TBC1 domain family member 10B [Brachionus plicatilis]|uniref:TBC1 domain family member 10B n=1 Tax=Brachionus plicatilis TaxID=10195 RepID=A0A3M7Q245_BRAPC|nr:TBC1 domain family member 10B [Brachionus plicatilis]